MSKFGCTCGHVISDVVCPNEVTGDLVSDKSEEKFFEELSSIIKDYFESYQKDQVDEWMKKYFNEMYPKDLPASDMMHDAIHTKYCNLTLAVMECEKCGRLWIQRNVGENFYREYVPAKDDGIRVLGFNEYKDI